MNSTANLETLEDAQLVALGVNGNREAFGQLVARYQSPVCALSYSACGNLSQSEDVAQETFIIAWRKLAELQEPAKFKWWLFGIARNLLNNTFRRQSHNPLAAAEPLDESLVSVAASNPAGQAISKEEEEILWRSLEHIPETYREPLVLFYREHQSIERVAATLDLSEEAVRQRLSRGRKLLQDRVMAFIEGALRQTAPGQVFTLSVVTALPHLSAVAGSSAVGGSTAGKAAVAVGFMGTLKSLLIKFLPGAFATYLMTMVFTESKRERNFALKAFAGVWILAFLCPAILYLGGYLGRHYWDAHPQTFNIVTIASIFGFVAVLGPYTFWIARVQNRMKQQAVEQSPNPRAFSFSQPYEYRSSWTFLGLPLLHVRWHCVKEGKTLPAVGWIANGNKAYGILFASGTIAVGGISCGACPIGIFAVGGFAIGGFAFGGMALGLAAMGGASVGYLAFGGGAIGWLAASGGATLARHFAMGGGAIAEHANDHAAWLFMHHNFFYRHTYAIFDVLILLTWLLPPGLMLYYKRRRQRSLSAQ